MKCIMVSHFHINSIKHYWPLMNRCIGGVMVSVFGSNAVNFGFDTQSGQKVKPKIIKLVFTASLLSTQQ